jgi:hypothetical protein
MKTRHIALVMLATTTHLVAFAHQGHGIEGSGHWHATDTLGFVGMAAIVSVAWFLGKGD